MKETAIIGLGSSKIHTLTHIAEQPLENVALHFVDTVQHAHIPTGVNFHLIGKHRVNGAGCGGDISLGQKIAAENTELLWELIPSKGRVVFLSSIVGGTGAGLLPSMIKLANGKNSAVFAIVTLPLIPEGQARTTLAKHRLKSFEEHSNQIETISQATIQPYLPKKVFTDEKLLFELLNRATAWKALSYLF